LNFLFGEKIPRYLMIQPQEDRCVKRLQLRTVVSVLLFIYNTALFLFYCYTVIYIKYKIKFNFFPNQTLPCLCHRQ
ncbi:MAG: hypothetical protein WCR52_07180, partial [Bacteroidota bacterium]